MSLGARPLYLILSLVLLLSTAETVMPQALFEMPEGVESRWANGENPKGEKGKAGQANGGRKGAPAIAVPAGESRLLAEASGSSGVVQRIWMTLPDRSPRMLRSLRIDMYWDGAKTPAVSAPLGDFFGIGLGLTAQFQSALFSSPEGRSFNCFVPMPFKTSMKIVLTNESNVQLAPLFYEVNYTIGNQHPRNTLYFHAHYRRESPTQLQHDYELLPRVEGRGRYLGANIGVVVNQKAYADTWWGEGEVKIYLDGDRALPTLSGTGTEDYIGTGWGQGRFAHDISGSPVADEKNMRWCFYRYHIPDPIFFYREIRVTIQQIGSVTPTSRVPSVQASGLLYRAGPGLVVADLTQNGLFEREDDWSSCAYFYLDRPEDGLPPLDSVGKRIAGL
jgi:hypothetical protein